MKLFKKNKSKLDITPGAMGKVEIELEQQATQEAIDKAKEVNKNLGRLLEENGFTIKIYLATGGGRKTRKAGHD